MTFTLHTLAHLGRVDDMPHADYLAVPAVSSGGFKALRKSPWHFRMLADPELEHEPKAGTPAMLAGTILHCALLEPQHFAYRHPVGPDAARNTREWKDWAQHLSGEVTPISPLQHKVASAQARSLLDVPEVGQLFAREGVNEVSIFWHDQATGLACKARPDRVVSTPAGVILFDAKTAADASRRGFARAAATFAYHVQAAWYSRGWRAATGDSVAGFVFGVVESEYPYAAAAYMLHEDDLAQANALCNERLAHLAQCVETDTWPGYPDGLAKPLRLPAWAHMDNDEGFDRDE